MSSLNLTPELCFEPRFRMFIINGYHRKKKALAVLGLLGEFTRFLENNISHPRSIWTKFFEKKNSLKRKEKLKRKVSYTNLGLVFNSPCRRYLSAGRTLSQ